MATVSKTVLPALVTGLLFALSLPPFDLEWLGWVAFVPLLLAAHGRRPLEAFGLGMLAGAFCGVVQAGWYHDTARLFWSYIPFLWLAFLFGFAALAAALMPKIASPMARVLWVASVGVGGEWLTSWLPLPLNIALCQYRNIPLIQIASLAGIWGVSFLLWLVNAALAEAIGRRKFMPLGVGASLVVLSLGGEFDPASAKDETRQLARELNTALVVGYSDDARPRPFNCAALLAPSGDVLTPVHHKVHLYLAEQQTNQSGHAATVVGTDFGRVGLEICFDSCYTGTTRETVQQGAQIIAMPNYDPPTPRGVLHRLHGAMLPFRAVENRVPFVRADSNGLSQIVDAWGHIRAQSPLYRPDVLVGSVLLGSGTGTFFTRWGDWLAYLCLPTAALGFFGPRIRKR